MLLGVDQDGKYVERGDSKYCEQPFTQSIIAIGDSKINTNESTDKYPPTLNRHKHNYDASSPCADCNDLASFIFIILWAG